MDRHPPARREPEIIDACPSPASPVPSPSPPAPFPDFHEAFGDLTAGWGSPLDAA
ncbi:hypothetical protein AB0958_03295 [Streptomyces sp. NPDC006655]|uniref:hypothetical protein n=1 Tax=Streptomyces sp. NPDC006655 TaxID=3156898 RepID=UPI003453AEC2